MRGRFNNRGLSGIAGRNPGMYAPQANEMEKWERYFEVMGNVKEDRAQARAEAEGEELTAAMRQPGKSISTKAGRIERESPLFFGQGENPTLF